MPNSTKILRIDASARHEGANSRALADATIDHLASLGRVETTLRDVSLGLPFVSEDWVAANFTPAENRTDAQKERLSFSDQLVEEIKQADILVMATPIYNFGIPAALKAWVDMVARAGLSFRYSPNGPVGLLTGKRAIILVASGGTQVGSEIDFATPYLRHALGFIGIDDVEIIAADALSRDAEAKLANAHARIKTLSL